MEEYVRQAPMKAMKNKENLHGMCSCYHCLSEFDISTIIEWTDGGLTALCPHCCADSVLPICEQELLKKIQAYWF